MTLAGVPRLIPPATDPSVTQRSTNRNSVDILAHSGLCNAEQTRVSETLEQTESEAARLWEKLSVSTERLEARGGDMAGVDRGEGDTI